MKLSDILKEYNRAANEIFGERYYAEQYVNEDRHIPEYDNRPKEQVMREVFSRFKGMSFSEYYEGQHKANLEKAIKTATAANIPKAKINSVVKNIEARVAVSKSPTPYTVIARMARKDNYKSHVQSVDKDIEAQKKIDFMKAFGPKIEKDRER